MTDPKLQVDGGCNGNVNGNDIVTTATTTDDGDQVGTLRKRRRRKKKKTESRGTRSGSGDG